MKRGAQVAGRIARSNIWEVDVGRVVRRSLIGGVVLLAVVVIWRRVPTPVFGFDFHGGIWKVGHDLLNGRSPYPAPDSRLLFSVRNSFVTPPLLAIVGVPFSLLPFKVALALWCVVCVGAFAAALFVLGVRDARLYVLAICSLPLVESIWLGQPDGLFALLAALAWRHRDSSRGAVAVGVLIAAKLLAWPLLIWLLVTRRFRLCGVAVSSALMLLVTSWALIDFHGLAQYPRLLEADAKAFENWMYSLSPVGAAMHAGASASAATGIAILFALGVSACIVTLAKRSDESWFTAAVAFGLLVSPVMWAHYLVLLFVPLAISRRNRIGPWLLACALWVNLLEGPFALRIGVTLATATAIVAWSNIPPHRLRPRFRMGLRQQAGGSSELAVERS